MPSIEAEVGGRRSLTLDLHFPRRPSFMRRTIVHLIIEDVAEADAEAPVLFKSVAELHVAPDGSVPPLEFELPLIEGAAEPAVRVHVDQGATGTLTRGDYINPARVSLPGGRQARCDVPLVEIT